MAQSRSLSTNTSNNRATAPPPQSPSSHSQFPSPWSSWTPQKLLSSSYKDLGPPKIVSRQFQNHLLSSPSCLTSLLNILFLETGKTGVHDHSIPIDMHDLLTQNVVLGNMLLRFPGTLLPLLEDAIVGAQQEMLKRVDIFYQIYNEKSKNSTTRNNNDQEPSSQQHNVIVKGIHGTRVHARLVNLPPHSSNCKPSLSSLTSHDVGKILQLSGTVTRASSVQMYESQRSFQCGSARSSSASRSASRSASANANGANGSRSSGGNGSKNKGCGATFVVKADLQCTNNALCQPTRCPTHGCKSKSFQIVTDSNVQNRSDYQEIKVQESIGKSSAGSGAGAGAGAMRTGAIPRALLIKLQHDLVDTCQPGDDVVIVGTLMSHWQMQSLVTMGDVNIGMAIHAHSVRVVHGGDSAGNGSGSGSSWDYIFDQNQNGSDDMDNNNNADSTTNGNMKGRGMVREEIIKEFGDFWRDNINVGRPIAARNFICQAVCPTLYGVSLVKMALLLTLIGGSSANFSGQEETGHRHSHGRAITNAENENDQPYSGFVDDEFGEEEAPVQFSLFDDDGESSQAASTRNPTTIVQRNTRHGRKAANAKANATVKTRRREQSHLLLVGDPGCGKSQFLRFAAALCPRSVLTSGSGTTSAGLTCAAIRDESSKEFTLEAGALVLADRGVCAIDEFSCIKPADRTTIHEAMEQQTLSVAKAGIVCKLNCRATVIAVTNAKGGIYDHEKPFTVNVGIEPPLLSRFDLIFKLIDGSDAAKDDNVATFLLNRAIQGTGYECSKATNKFGRPHWNIDKLRGYVATIKSCFHPSISSDASLLLEKHYSECRSCECGEVQVTVRLLESLIRLSQAHARLMYRNVVELDDAVAIILLMECTVSSTSSSSSNSLYIDPATAVFPDNDLADIEFIIDKKKVLEKYQMVDRLTPNECKIIADHEYNNNTMYSQNQPNFNDNEWDDVEAKNNLPFGAPTYSTPGKQNNMQAAVGSHDHYGRYTQKATPSPLGASPSGNANIGYGNAEMQNADTIGRKRRRNFSAD